MLTDKPTTCEHGAEMRHRLIERCETWCSRTGTRRTIFGLALTRNPAFLDRLNAGGTVTINVYDRVMKGLDALDMLDAVAGEYERPARKGRTDDAYDARATLCGRVEAIGVALGVEPQILALAITRDSTLLRDRGGVSEAQFSAYSARLDRIEKAL